MFVSPPWQSKLQGIQADMEAQAADHAEDMRAKNDVLTELMHQKQESDESLALSQEKLLRLSEELAYTNLQVRADLRS